MPVYQMNEAVTSLSPQKSCNLRAIIIYLDFSSTDYLTLGNI